MSRIHDNQNFLQNYYPNSNFHNLDDLGASYHNTMYWYHFQMFTMKKNQILEATSYAAD